MQFVTATVTWRKVESVDGESAPLAEAWADGCGLDFAAIRADEAESDVRDRRGSHKIGARGGAARLVAELVDAYVRG
jgi:hypothetical protein